MKTNTYAVTGATGSIGGQVARQLLAAGHKVRVLSREPQKVAALVALGAEAFAGASDDAAYLTSAFRGVDGVFAMTPPPYTAPDFRAAQGKVGRAVAEALAAAGVRNIVNLSSLAAELPAGTGPIKGLFDQEARLNALKGVNILHLRPAFFMENLGSTLALIESAGIVGTPLKAATVSPMIASKDIAVVAAQRLNALDFTGVGVLELHGERDLTMAEVTAALSTASGKALKYVQFAYDAAREAMVGAGLSADTAAQMVEMYAALNDGVAKPLAKRSAQTTTGTSIEVFARSLVGSAV